MGVLGNPRGEAILSSEILAAVRNSRALRTEAVINDPYDVGVKRSLANFEYLRTIGRNINRRLIQMERVSANCVISQRTFAALVLPSESDGKHVSGLCFGDPRVMACSRQCAIT